MTDLDDRLREHYRTQTLSEEAAAGLLAHAQEPVTKPSKWQRVMFSLQPNGLQLGMALAVLAAVSLLALNYGVHATRTEQALKEVAMNHSTRLEVEFAGQSLAGIDKQMALLPFDMSMPEQVAKQYQLKGARYCSLSGQLAAHVKLIDLSTEKPVSIFMTRAADELKTIDDSDESVDGVNVRIWRESGLLYAMVGSSKLEKHE